MTLNSELKEAITMKTDAPFLDFEFDGIYNVYETSSDLGYIFTKNDNLKLSNDFYKHLLKFKDSYYVISSTEQEFDKTKSTA